MIDEEPISLQEMQEIAGGANHRDEPGSSGIGGNTSKDEPPKLPAKKRGGLLYFFYNYVNLISDNNTRVKTQRDTIQ